jgi:hypothetical protein
MVVDALFVGSFENLEPALIWIESLSWIEYRNYDMEEAFSQNKVSLSLETGHRATITQSDNELIHGLFHKPNNERFIVFRPKDAASIHVYYLLKDNQEKKGPVALNISLHTAMYVADSTYPKLFRLLKTLAPELRREAAVEWRTNYRKWIDNPDKQAAKSAEEGYFAKWTK